MKRCCIAVIICGFFTMLGMQGCTKTLKMSQVPELKSGSPLSEIPSTTFILRDFRDARSAESVVFPVVQGEKFLIEPGPDQIITQALEKELTRTGHKVLRSGDFTTTDVVLEGSVIRFDVFFKDGPKMSIDRSATVETRIAVTIKTSNDTFTKMYRGTDQEYTFGLKGLDENLGRAVSSLVKEFTMDPDFLEKLKKIQKVQ
jgi:hypothetical protein